MKRSGGRSGRPFGHLTIKDLEKLVSDAKADASELTAILAELGHRTTRRALELKDLVGRLLRSLSDATGQLAPSKPNIPDESVSSRVSVMPAWNMQVDKSDFVMAIGTARRRPTLRRVADGPGGFEADVILTSWNFGLSIRSSDSAMDIDGKGVWTAPIRVNGAALRRLAPKLPDGPISITYADGSLSLGATKFPASEI